jgi:glycosyltransferase involved in cell wall biosynthesis
VDLLLELARREPALELTVLWRPFGPESDDALRTVQTMAPPNVHVVPGRVDRIQESFRAAHFVVAPFRSVGKPVPNSVLEALAVGRPALVSDFTDLGGLLERAGAGLGFRPTIDSLGEAFDRLRSQYAELQASARSCAERHFSLTAVVRQYGGVYDKLTRSASGSSH